MKKRTKRNYKMAVKVWGRMIIAGIMCAVISMSFSVLANGLLAQEIGYEIYTQDAQGNIIDETPEVYYYADGATPAENVELREGKVLQPISEMSPGISAVVNMIVLFCSLFLLGVFPYNLLWEMGSKDENKVRYGHSRLDKWRGLKIGALANIPCALMYILLLVARFGTLTDAYLTVYRVLNVPFLTFINWVIGTELSVVTVWQMLALLIPLLFIPLVCFTAYLLGYYQFSLKEHLTYENSSEQPDEEI